MKKARKGDRTRMIKPHSVGSLPPAPPSKSGEPVPPAPEKPKGGGGGGDPPGNIHTAIVGLLRELPPPGSDWPAAKKKKFLGAFEAVLDVVYPSEEPLA